MTAIGKATEQGIDEVAQEVVAPHFHGPNHVEKKVRAEVSISLAMILRSCASHG